MLLLDIDVLIDVRRNTPAALAWIEAAGTEAFEVPAVVITERLTGCRNRQNGRATREFLAAFPVAYPAAIELLERHAVSSGLGIPDCLMASRECASLVHVPVQPATPEPLCKLVLDCTQAARQLPGSVCSASTARGGEARPSFTRPGSPSGVKLVEYSKWPARATRKYGGCRSGGPRHRVRGHR